MTIAVEQVQFATLHEDTEVRVANLFGQPTQSGLTQLVDLHVAQHDKL